MRSNYDEISVKIININAADVITTSVAVEGDNNGDNEVDAGGAW